MTRPLVQQLQPASALLLVQPHFQARFQARLQTDALRSSSTQSTRDLVEINSRWSPPFCRLSKITWQMCNNRNGMRTTRNTTTQRIKTSTTTAQKSASQTKLIHPHNPQGTQLHNTCNKPDEHGGAVPAQVISKHHPNAPIQCLTCF